MDFETLNIIMDTSDEGGICQYEENMSVETGVDLSTFTDAGELTTSYLRGNFANVIEPDTTRPAKKTKDAATIGQGIKLDKSNIYSALGPINREGYTWRTEYLRSKRIYPKRRRNRRKY